MRRLALLGAGGWRRVASALREPEPPINQLIRRDRRWQTFGDAIDYVNYEGIEGAVLEFGVFGGLSLALLAQAHAFDDKGMTRVFAGFDSFAGLPMASEEHARWREGDCARGHSWHPLVAPGEAVSPGAVRDLFRLYRLPAPELAVGDFAVTLPLAVPARYPRIALVHIDCDLYESTRTVLAGVAPALEDGAVVLFDDWFHYRGNPGRGEARAFAEFLAAHPEWGAAHYRSYATYCNAFILYRR